MNNSLTISHKQKAIGILLAILLLTTAGYYLYQSFFASFNSNATSLISTIGYTVPAQTSTPTINAVLICDLGNHDCLRSIEILLNFQMDLPNDITYSYILNPQSQIGENAAVGTLIASKYMPHDTFINQLISNYYDWQDLESTAEAFAFYVIEAKKDPGIDESQLIEEFRNTSSYQKDVNNLKNEINKLGEPNATTVYINGTLLTESLTMEYLYSYLNKHRST